MAVGFCSPQTGMPQCLSDFRILDPSMDTVFEASWNSKDRTGTYRALAYVLELAVTDIVP